MLTVHVHGDYIYYINSAFRFCLKYVIRKENMRVTISDVAKKAGVSRGTVDRVIYDRPGVSKASRLKVEQAIKELEFNPNYNSVSRSSRKIPKTIHFIVAPSFNPFVDEVIKGIKRAQKEYGEYGLEIKVHAHRDFGRDEQLLALGRYDKDKCSGLIIVPVVDDDVRNRINTLVDSGLPVVIYNSDLPGAKRLCFVGQDQYKSGATAGMLMNITVRQGKVAVIWAMEGLMCHRDRKNGFTETISDDIEVVEGGSNYDMDEPAYEITKKLIADNEDLKGIYITGGGVDGIARALKERGKEKDIAVICHDLTSVSTRLIKEGIVNYAIGQDPSYQSYKSVSILFDYIYRGITPGRDAVLTNIDIRLITNID